MLFWIVVDWLKPAGLPTLRRRVLNGTKLGLKG
jgi:hypothetical protein